MTRTRAQRAPIRISESHDAERSVVLQSDDDDVFVRTGKQVIAACRLGISLDLWLQELHAMLGDVQRWAADRGAQIRTCYCAPRGGRVALFFAPASSTVDFTLADELAELSVNLLQRYNVGSTEVQQVPWDELDRFLDPQAARHVHGEPWQPHPTVEA